MKNACWLLKSDPSYPWEALVEEGGTEWTGVRNYEARGHLRAMKLGDLALYYHSVRDKVVVGVARISREARPDPTAEEPGWVSVAIVPVVPLAEPVALGTIKADPALAQMQLVRRSRLSVSPVTAAEFARILALGRTRLPTTSPVSR